MSKGPNKCIFSFPPKGNTKWDMKKFYYPSRETNNIPATAEVTMRIRTRKKPGALISISKRRKPHPPPTPDDRQLKNRMIWSHAEPGLKRPAVGAPAKICLPA